ncbi:MAG: hypothetical protein WCA46_03760 [Actinocatenispora sp.]
MNLSETAARLRGMVEIDIKEDREAVLALTRRLHDRNAQLEQLIGDDVYSYSTATAELSAARATCQVMLRRLDAAGTEITEQVNRMTR